MASVPQLTVSIDAVIHERVWVLAQCIFEAHGVRVDSVHVRWRDESSAAEVRYVVDGVLVSSFCAKEPRR